MGRTWAKFSTLPAKKHRKFETATGKQTFGFNHQGRIRVKTYVSDDTLINQIHVFIQAISKTRNGEWRNGERGTRNGERGTGNLAISKTRNGEWRNEERGTGNGERGISKRGNL